MENEELAALRATLLAAQRQSLAVKVAQARLSALLSDGDELLPYVLARSCSDPRDRRCSRSDLTRLRLLEGCDTRLRSTGNRRTPAYEPIPTRPSRLAAFLALMIVLSLVGQMLGMLLLQPR